MIETLKKISRRNSLLGICKLLYKWIKGFHPLQPSDFKEFPIRIENKKIVVTENINNYHERFRLRSGISRILQSKLPIYSVKVKDIAVGYYDRCLWRYVDEVCFCGRAREDVCWNIYAQNNKCVDKLDEGEIFDDNRKKVFLKRIKKAHLDLNDNIFRNISIDREGFIYMLSNKRQEAPYNKAENIYESIRRYGWNSFESICRPMIVGFSKTTGLHQMISGRHRMAVLKCFVNRGVLNPNLKVKCHYVEYPFDTLTYTRPYANKCKKCRWNERLRFQNGSHQDFSVEAGKVDIISPKAKLKWQLMEKAPSSIFAGKKIVDIGSYRGLYCLKSLEKGVADATVFEPSEPLFNEATRVSIHIADDRLRLYQGDFYSSDGVDFLQQGGFDTALFLGVIHHLLRIGIQRGILCSFDELMGRIASFAGSAVIIEFAMPKQNSLNMPELKPHKEAFSRKNFGQALAKHFPINGNLGKCKYRKNRFMYYGIKKENDRGFVG